MHKGRTLFYGALIGAATGLVAALLLNRRAEKNERETAITAGEGLKLECWCSDYCEPLGRWQITSRDAASLRFYYYESKSRTLIICAANELSIYSYPSNTITGLVCDVIFLRQRVFRDDALACVSRLIPPLQVITGKIFQPAADMSLQSIIIIVPALPLNGWLLPFHPLYQWIFIGSSQAS